MLAARLLVISTHRRVVSLCNCKRPARWESANVRLCAKVLALASAIDRDCAARLACHSLSKGHFVLLHAAGGGQPEDRRRLTVRLTSAGETTAAKLFNEHTQWIETLFTDVSPEERVVPILS